MSLTSCQTIPVKELFWWTPKQETFGECKGKCIQRGGGHTELIVCSVSPVRGAPGGMTAGDVFELLTFI